MEKRALLAFILSFMVLIGWSLLFAPKRNIPEKKRILKKTTKKELRPVFLEKEKEIIVDTPLYRIRFSNIGPSIKQIQLKKYYRTAEKESGWVKLIPLEDIRPITLGIDLEEKRPLVYKANRDFLKITSKERTLEFRADTEDFSILKLFRFYPDSYKIDVKVEVSNLKKEKKEGAFFVKLKTVLLDHKKIKGYSHLGLVSFIKGELKKIKLKEGERKVFSGDVKWLAYETKYFISAVITNTEGILHAKRFKKGILMAYYKGGDFSLPPMGKISRSFILYLGPKEINVLKNIGYQLESVVNFGWTDFIAKPILYLLRFFYKYLHNYGLAIILLSVLIKLIFWPLSKKSYESMKEMQRIQPLIERIREKYKDDRERMNRELLNLYRTYKVNPFSGCLPIIIQIPVFFALYRVLCDAIELRHAPFILWINDLSAPDRLFRFPFQIPFMEPPYGIPMLTLLMGATMYIQQKMSPQPGDPSQAKIMMLLPLVFTVMFINFPSGLVLYWLVNNILSIFQQYMTQKDR